VSDIAIKVENLSKRYFIRHQRASGEGLRHVLQEKLTAPFRWMRKGVGSRESGVSSGVSGCSNSDPKILNPDSRILNPSPAAQEEFWALRDVSFDIRQGEVVGIVGRNGAGKSTLLKILSRITEPTSGRITIDGRVASLLEVGTGFHPELTGRENIFLNGAILGMSRVEIKRKFDEIVAFAEVEKFLDTPVKRYSSGMYVRLAFSVAAHLQPEILIVDEVLAVGDAQFQKKCIGKMQEVAETSGRTVLFVSHNMAVIQSLCSRCIALDGGRVAIDAVPARAIQAYLSEENEPASFERDLGSRRDPYISSGRIELSEVLGRPAMRITISVVSSETHAVGLDLRVCDRMGAPVGYGSLGAFDERSMLRLRPGSNTCAFAMPVDHLANGSYYLSLDLTVPFVRYIDRVERCLYFNVHREPSSGCSRVMLQEWGCGSVEINLLRDLQE
jgi:lipopolysaccharide transport system ATP-binding protein